MILKNVTGERPRGIIILIRVCSTQDSHDMISVIERNMYVSNVCCTVLAELRFLLKVTLLCCMLYQCY